MKEEDKIFNRLIKDKLESHSLPVEADLWVDLESRLQKKKQEKLLVKWISGIAATAACLAILFFFNPLKHNQAVDPVLLSEMPEAIKPKAENQANEVTSETKAELEQVAEVINTKKIGSLAKSSASSSEILSPSDSTLTNKKKEDEKSKTRPVKETTEFTLEKNDILLADLTTPPKKKKSNMLSFSFSGGNTSSLFAYNNNDLFYEGDFLGNNPSSGMNGYPEDEYYSEIDHSPPLSFGISLRKSLHPQFALESGLTYTYLHSKATTRNGSRKKDTKLHYLGIPLNLVFIIPELHPKWDFYLLAGGMVEKGIYAEIETMYNSSKIKETGSVDDFQWSLNMAGGVAYKFHKDISIFFEPRFIYYLNNNQPLSVRKTNDWNLGLSAGFRFSW
ncbi:porin family protein [Bacteroidales bacterium OttesenSCG-928-A17]|nr:porin family protein [Bacteroidales bacterium OttesenSCG-928-A17]